MSKQRQVLGLVLAIGVASLFFGVATPKVSAAQDCDNNAIISCGFSGASDFITKVRANDSLNGHHDLQAIYAHYGLEPADYDRFVSSARPGTAYKNGTIVVDGQTVATGAQSIGRLASFQGSGYFTTSIAGAGTFYGNTNQQAFGHDSIPVMVMFNDKGVMQFAVLTSCGNPEFGTPNVPNYSCNLLTQQPVSGSPGTFKFTTSASASNYANITKVVYDFGDGTSDTESSTATSVQHTYTVGGSYTAKVTVYVSLPGNTTVQVTSANCATIVTVVLPAYQCVQLAAATIGDSKYKYQFVVTGKASGGASIVSADFNFGDGTSASANASGSTATIIHPYAKDGSYRASAVLHISLPGGRATTVTSSGCATVVSVAVPFYSCVQLGGAIIDQSKFSYSFIASANFGNGVTLSSVDFDFGDGTATKGVSPNGTTASTTHMYAVAGNYTVTGTLHFNVGGAVQNATCTAVVTPTQPPTPECKPGIPQGSALCTPCPSNATIASNSPQCAVPAAATTSLPNTGAGDVIGIFGVVAVAGFFFYHQFVYRKRAVGTAAADAATVGHIGATPAVDNNELTAQVIAHRASHRNAQPLSHPTYHRPHRFRPRSHNDK